MKVPFFDLRRLYLEQKKEIDLAISQVLDSGRYILGEACKNFEILLKNYLSPQGLGEVVSCNSGTDALVLSLLASGVESGDHVVTVSHTAIPTISAIRSIGAIPIFIDIDPHNWLMDPKKIETAITSRTKAVIPVHLYGNVVQIPEIQEILQRMGREDVIIIEDAAQAQGASFQSQQAGTMGRFGAFSFYPTKNLGALGDGGAVFCKSQRDAERIRMLKNYGKRDHYLAEIIGGVNSRLDEIQAAILEVRLRKVLDWNERKSELMDRYRKELEGLPISFPKILSGCRPAWHLCVISLETEEVRSKLIQHLSKNGIETLVHYPIPTHQQEALAPPPQVYLPVTESLTKKILSLPFNSCLKVEEEEYFTKVFKSFFS